MLCSPHQDGARDGEIIVPRRWAAVDRSILPIVHLKHRQLLISTAAGWSIEDANFIIMQLTVQKIEQIATANGINADCAVFDAPWFKAHPVARAGDLKSNHPLWAKPLHQNFGIGWIEAQIGEDEVL